MLLKLLVGKKVVAIVSAYAPQQGLSVDEKDKFFETLLLTVSKIGDNEIIVLGGDLNGHVGKSEAGYEGVHGGYGYGVRNADGERILELGDALGMVVCNMLFEKQDSRLITYTSGGNVSQIDYIMVKRSDRKFVKDVKVIAGEECALQHQLLVCDLTIKATKEAKKPFIPKRRVWKLKDATVREEFLTGIRGQVSDTCPNGSVEDLWYSLKDSLLKVSDKVCGWTSKPPRHHITWWWNDDVEKALKKREGSGKHGITMVGVKWNSVKPRGRLRKQCMLQRRRLNKKGLEMC